MAEAMVLERKAHIRRAKDCLVAMDNAGEHHRAAHNQLIDYRLQEIMEEGARAVGTVPGFCGDKPAFSSPWHYHECDMQIGIVLDGSVEMAYADGGYSRMGKGDIGMIPGGVVHDVSHASADFLTTEFTFPGTFSTIDAPAPPAGTSSAAAIFGVSAAVRFKEADGLLYYAYPVAAPHSERYAVERQRRSRVEAFQPHALNHNDEFQLLYVTKGQRTIELDGEEHQLGEGDLLVLPKGVPARDIDASEEHEAVCMRLLAQG